MNPELFLELKTPIIIIRILLMLVTFDCFAADRLIVGEFSTRGLAEWEEHSFNGNTEYSVTELDGIPVVKAVSRASASVLFRRLQIDLAKTPYLYWRWRIENTVNTTKETEKSGDDYPARIFIVHDGGIFPWQKHSVNYVWASNLAQGTIWPSAYTPQDKMMAVQSGPQDAGRWLEERRDVREDFRRLFDKDIRYVDMIALMTDTDDTGEKATAYYGNIYFAAD